MSIVDEQQQKFNPLEVDILSLGKPLLSFDIYPYKLSVYI